MKQSAPEIVKTRVTISVTYHKSCDVYVEEGYTDVDLREAVKQQVGLPVEDEKGSKWYCDEFEVIED